jgi:hypothetical protein
LTLVDRTHSYVKNRGKGRQGSKATPLTKGREEIDEIQEWIRQLVVIWRAANSPSAADIP